jgi:hypothetical protein
MNRKKNREKKKRGANTNRWQPLWSWFVWYQSRCLLSLSPVSTWLDSTWWSVLGRTKGYLGDMRCEDLKLLKRCEDLWVRCFSICVLYKYKTVTGL